ncbi:MAG: pre-16S rRNA-processing nuclease YqgF [Acidaminococcaceae bacterium]
MNKEFILGIDPGSSKTGAALLDSAGNIVRMDILWMDEFAKNLTEFLQTAQPETCIIGDGTTSTKLQQTLAEVLPALEIVVCDEAHSTEEARVLYWQLNPPQGWRRLMPLGMLTPPVPLDAYAAVVLVRRYLKKNYNI